MAEFEVRNTNGGQPFYCRAVASNGEVLMHSENYARKEDAKRCAELVSAGGKVTDLT